MSTNTRAQVQPIMAPSAVKRQFPISSDLRRDIQRWRRTICDIMDGRDPRLLLFLGPCSIHDPIAAVDYAKRIVRLRAQCPNIFFVMRANFETPRTRKGWSGFLHDPKLDGSNAMQQGVLLTRQLLLSLGNMGIPTATETLSLIAPQYFDDLLSFVCIGAPTTLHRELASRLTVPVGFQNSADGNLSAAINSMFSAAEAKVFMGINATGRVAEVRTRGNPHCFLVLRAYKEECVGQVDAMLTKEGVTRGLVVDASHGNSAMQSQVVRYLATHRHRRCKGLMIDSFIVDGNQPITARPLRYGVSVTDECIGWTPTKELVLFLNKHV